uniref:ORF65c n=1 Tax=Pinus koraiensis TaxID=88728 RepID=A4QMB3_PINKO|nr:ORF65c [Pinus koraiensis]ABP35450.1 ORF65c [Pinus koraiensis]
MSLPGWQHGEANGRWDSINLFRPGMISSWSHFIVETRKNTSFHLRAWLRCASFRMQCQTKKPKKH